MYHVSLIQREQISTNSRIKRLPSLYLPELFNIFDSKNVFAFFF